MTSNRVYITGMGIIGPLGDDLTTFWRAICQGESRIAPLTLFPIPSRTPLPVGQIDSLPLADTLPRTHQLAIRAASEAMADAPTAPDAIVMGTTTGGILTTEEHFKSGSGDATSYRYHGLGTVSEAVAKTCGCTGPTITVSTACASGSAAIALALAMLSAGRAQRVLAGGADCLSRLTYYGFNSLQLIDPDGARPFDRDRRGMSVGEAAAMVLLEAAPAAPSTAIAEVLGTGLSCDAHHPAAPQPEGRGARQAIVSALDAAGVSAESLDYIHLHGTGTDDNDLAEALALRAVSEEPLPPVSSCKGAMGHSLAAAGAAGVVLTALGIAHGRILPNPGWSNVDPKIGISPQIETESATINTALVNAFGFGGNNAVVVLGNATARPDRPQSSSTTALGVRAMACRSGRGNTAATLSAADAGTPCAGTAAGKALLEGVDPRRTRRLKRLPKMVLGLAQEVWTQSGCTAPPAAITFGTAWGPLSETHAFLTQLFTSQERFTSPIDFIGSVHNAPAGQAAMLLGATGPNLTTSGGDVTFAQALTAAWLMSQTHDDPALLAVADEHHPGFSPLFDRSVRAGERTADGGAAFCIQPPDGSEDATLQAFLTAVAADDRTAITDLVQQLGETGPLADRYAAIIYDIPAGYIQKTVLQRELFERASGLTLPWIDGRQMTGQFAAAAALMAALAVHWIVQGQVPPVFGLKEEILIADSQGILIVCLGNEVAAVEVMPPT